MIAGLQRKGTLRIFARFLGKPPVESPEEKPGFVNRVMGAITGSNNEKRHDITMPEEVALYLHKARAERAQAIAFRKTK